MTTILYLRSYNNFNASRKLAGIYRAAEDFGWNIQVIDMDRCTTAETIATLIKLWQPKGLIVESAAESCDLPLSIYESIPSVFIDRNPQANTLPVFCVTHDSAAEAQLAARELLALDLASYAYVPWLEPLFWCHEREAAYCRFMRLHGKTVSRFSGRHNSTTMHYSSGELGAWLGELPRPAGVLAANDYIAQQVISAATWMGLSIPNDLVVLGIDDEEIICENTHPTLSSIRPDFEGAGERSVRLLQKLIDSPRLRPREEKYGPVRIVRRESSRRLRTGDTAVLKALETIRLKACSGLTAQDVLAAFPVARRQAEIRFRKAVGRSVLDEIQRIRIERAKELLTGQPELPLKAIANFCGYSSATVLYKTFKAHTGVAPTDWRTS